MRTELDLILLKEALKDEKEPELDEYEKRVAEHVQLQHLLKTLDVEDKDADEDTTVSSNESLT